MEIKEQTISGGNVQNIGYQYNYYGDTTFQEYVSSILFSIGQTGKSYYYYRSGLIPFYGRDQEIEILNKFLIYEAKFSIIAVTGNGGSGKSRLIYEFLKSVSDWDKAYLDWREFSINQMNYIINSFVYDKDLILVIDYVLAYADEIGDWLCKIKNHMITLKNKIRIVVIEREGIYSHVDSGNVSSFTTAKKSLSPYWYSKIIEKNRLEDYLYIVIELYPLENSQLLKIARALIEKEKNEYISDDKIIENIIIPLEQMDAEKKRPVFLLFITQAWIMYNDVRNWDLEELLRWISNNELRRIYELSGQDTEITAVIAYLLCYATMVSGINSKQIHAFMADDIKKIARFAQKKRSNIVHLFNEINLESRQYFYIEPLVPDLLGEYFCVDFFTGQILNGNDIIISQFARNAIESKVNEYASFWIRISQDFPDIDLEPIGKQLCACGIKDINAVKYGQFLYTLVINIRNPRFQVMLNNVFQEGLFLEEFYIKARAENLVYLAIFPFEFPGISDDRNKYLLELQSLKERYLSCWPPYVMALSYMLETGAIEEKKYDYLHEVREYLKQHFDENTAFYFCCMLKWFYKNEDNKADYYLEIRDMVVNYNAYYNLASFFMTFLGEIGQCYTKENYDLVIMFASRYVSERKIREVCFGLIEFLYRDSDEEFVRIVYKLFDLTFRKIRPSIPRLFTVYCKVLRKLMEFSTDINQRRNILMRIYNILLSYGESEKNTSLKSIKLGLDCFEDAVILYCSNLESYNARKSFLSYIFKNVQKEEGKIRNEVLDRISDVLMCDLFEKNKSTLMWKKDIQYQIYIRIQNQHVLKNLLKASMDLYSLFPLKEKERYIQELLLWLQKEICIWRWDIFRIIFSGLIDSYISYHHLSETLKEKLGFLKNQENEIYIVDLLSKSWDILELPHADMIKMSRKILKYHCHKKIMLEYQDWLLRKCNGEICNKRVVDELGRLYYTYNNLSDAVYWVKGMYTVISHSYIRKEKIKYLQKMNELTMQFDDSILLDYYRRAFEIVILEDNGKYRKKLLSEYRYSKAFTIKTYIELLIQLAKQYNLKSGCDYLREITITAAHCTQSEIEYAFNLINNMIIQKTFDTEVCLDFCKHLINEGTENLYLYYIFPAISLRSVTVNEMYVELFFLLAFMDNIRKSKVFVDYRALSVSVHCVNLLLGMILEHNKYWDRADDCVDRILKFVHTAKHTSAIPGIIKDLIFAIDLFAGLKIRKKYYEFLYGLSQIYPIVLSTSNDGHLIVECNSVEVISKSIVTKHLIYPSNKKEWILLHLTDEWND